MALTLLRCDDVGPTVELTPSTLVIVSFDRLGSSLPLSWRMPRPLSAAAPAAVDPTNDRGPPSPNWTLSPVPSNLPSSRSFSSMSTYFLGGFRVGLLDWSTRGERLSARGVRTCGNIPLVTLLFREDPARRRARFGAPSVSDRARFGAPSVSGICVNILPQSCTRLAPHATTKTQYPASAGPRTSVSLSLGSRMRRSGCLSRCVSLCEARRIYRLGGKQSTNIYLVRFGFSWANGEGESPRDTCVPVAGVAALFTAIPHLVTRQVHKLYMPPPKTSFD